MFFYSSVAAFTWVKYLSTSSTRWQIDLSADAGALFYI